MNELAMKLTKAMFEGASSYYILEMDNRGNITDVIRCKDKNDLVYTVAKYGTLGYEVEKAYGNGIHVSVVTAPKLVIN